MANHNIRNICYWYIFKYIKKVGNKIMKYFNYDIFRKNEKGKYEKVNEMKTGGFLLKTIQSRFSCDAKDIAVFSADLI